MMASNLAFLSETVIIPDYGEIADAEAFNAYLNACKVSNGSRGQALIVERVLVTADNVES